MAHVRRQQPSHRPAASCSRSASCTSGRDKQFLHRNSDLLRSPCVRDLRACFDSGYFSGFSEELPVPAGGWGFDGNGRRGETQSSGSESARARERWLRFPFPKRPASKQARWLRDSDLGVLCCEPLCRKEEGLCAGDPTMRRHESLAVATDTRTPSDWTEQLPSSVLPCWRPRRRLLSRVGRRELAESREPAACA